MGELFFQSSEGEWRKLGNATFDDCVTETSSDDHQDTFLHLGDSWELTADLTPVGDALSALSAIMEITEASLFALRNKMLRGEANNWRKLHGLPMRRRHGR